MQTASTPAVATPTTLTIVVDSEVEKEQLQEYIAMADQYSLSKHEEADQYYATKKEEADALRGQAEAEIERRVAEAIAQERKRMKQEIADAESEAKEIIKKAKADAASLVEQLEERRKELDEKLEAYTRDIALLEATKASISCCKNSKSSASPSFSDFSFLSCFFSSSIAASRKKSPKKKGLQKSWNSCSKRLMLIKSREAR